ncbi:MAG: M3 family metallopeptidase [Bacteroidales bacterium]|jgi:peptidyl-dipeptidase Dcp|nr:M3 family metallopeptidase [Bacteroidales bacterium]MDY0196287.1 M3 family metallopeptidase [Tenuifilaceae bacterium]
MRTITFSIMTIIIGFSLASCNTESSKSENPLLRNFNTKYNAPPFDKIKVDHYSPAIDSAIIEARAEVDAIIASTEEPTFENTIEALAFAGMRLGSISSILFNLNSAETDTSLQKVIREVAPKLTDFQNDISLNADLFERVKKVYNTESRDNLTPEQLTLLSKTYKGFVRSGANLSDDDKQAYREITRELSDISLQFDENILAETNDFTLHLTNSDKLSGLPKSLIDAAALEAKARELDGWVFTLHMPMYVPFMKYAENRELREQMYKAYNMRAFKDNDKNNTELIKRIVNLRLKQANLLGYTSYADFVLEERMAQSSDKVMPFLNELLDASLNAAHQELAEVEELAKSLGANHRIEKWDWSFYTEKLKVKLFNFNEEDLKPYFELEKVKEGIFYLANKLYGLTFKQVNDIPVYHSDVFVYEVYDKDDSFLSLLYLDFFPRSGKSGGAWMTSYGVQYTRNGQDTRPLISIVTNFTKPTSDTPSLLTFDEFTTFLHEFGHALHGMLSNITYPNLSGTSVYRDFVELPSQILENWAVEKEFLDKFAIHYKTGEAIPESMVQSIIDSQNFLAGNLSIRQLSFGLVDMAWHSIQKPFSSEVLPFEQKYMSKADVLPAVIGTAFSPAFSHIFAGGYAAGYYSYKWAEVLDADAYSVFQEKGIFNAHVAQSFRDNILSRGGSEHPMVLYKRFRGHEPTIEALLLRSGLKN